MAVVLPPPPPLPILPAVMSLTEDVPAVPLFLGLGLGALIQLFEQLVGIKVDNLQRGQKALYFQVFPFFAIIQTLFSGSHNVEFSNRGFRTFQRS